MEKKKLNEGIVIFDLETQKDFEEVKHDFTKLKFSVAVTRENKKDRVYRCDESEELIQQLKNATLIVGHNHIHFDYTVLEGYGLTKIEKEALAEKSYDTLVELQKFTGKRHSLDMLSKNNLPGHPGKLAPGLQCLVWYKEGRLDKIIELCVDDVHRTANIFGLIIKGTPLMVKYKKEDKWCNEKFTLPIPEFLKERMKNE